MKEKKISLIITCYNEKKNIIPMYDRIVSTFEDLKGYEFEAIYVDNDSFDGSSEVYKKLAKKDSRVKIIVMSRNMRSPQPSFVAGMSYASGDAVVFMHGDIQDPPEMIPNLLNKYAEGYDVVYGVRTYRRGYGILWNFYYKAFYFVLHRVSYIKIPLDAGEFSIVSRAVVDTLLGLPEYDYNVRCLRAFVGFRQIGIPYVREDRREGKSTGNFYTSILSAEDMIINFSFKPLRWIMWSGLFLMAISFLVFLANGSSFLLMRSMIVPLSWETLILLFVSGVQLFSLFILGLYISKIFLEVKGRPRFIVREVFNLTKIQKNQIKNDYEFRRPGVQGQ